MDILFPSLIDDLLDFGNKVAKEDKRRKAFRIHVQCLVRGKIEIAARIEEKYLKSPDYRYSDSAMAFGMAMAAQNP